MNIQLTPRAVEHVRRRLRGQEHAVGLRLGVRPSGCSGFSYTVGVAEAVGADDQAFQVEELTVVVDRQSLPFLEGMEVDFVREGLNERLTFRNPNVKEQCGCGESFAV